MKPAIEFLSNSKNSTRVFDLRSRLLLRHLPLYISRPTFDGCLRERALPLSLSSPSFSPNSPLPFISSLSPSNRSGCQTEVPGYSATEFLRSAKQAPFAGMVPFRGSLHLWPSFFVNVTCALDTTGGASSPGHPLLLATPTPVVRSLRS